MNIYMFLWLKDAPVYDPVSVESIVEFIDTFISCSSNDDDPYIASQTHRHTHTCRKNEEKPNSCRFNFPLPAMPKTTILVPLPKEEISQKMRENSTKIDNLMKYFFIKRDYLSIEEILLKLELTEEEYMLAVRSSIGQARVFLKRSSLEVGINAYNRDILHLFESNMDI